jgi:protease-4
MWTPSRVFTPEERLKLVAMLSDIYNDFTARVAEGRNMSAAQIDAVARGRVWSGQDAKTHGLVDAYGGFRSALAVAREKAGLNAEAPVTLVQYPAARSLLEEFMGVADDFENVKASLALLSGLKNAGVLDLLSEQSSRAPRDRVLRAPALEVK